jgi:phosphohistidine phosphatase
MRRLTLLRHADARWRDPAIADIDRPLNRRGTAEAEAIARRLAELGLRPALLLTSPARRAEQTSAILARELNLPTRSVRREDSLYLAESAEILRLLHELGPRIGHALLVGHNPGITDLANQLGPQPCNSYLATGAVCSLSFDAPGWTDIGPSTCRDVMTEAPRPRLFARWA